MDEHLFISYSRIDAGEFALRLADELEAGPPPYRAWVDVREMQPGREDWDRQLEEAIKTCVAVVFVMSEDSVCDTSGCKPEWVAALHYRRPVIPVRLRAGAKLPFRLSSRQFIDFSADFDRGLAELRGHLAWTETPQGVLQDLRCRLADAEYDLPRAGEQRRCVEEEIRQLRRRIDEQQRLVASGRAVAPIDAALVPERSLVAEVALALRVGVCAVADVDVQDVGVDAVDPKVLGRALWGEGDQLLYVTRGEVDERLRRHLAEARDSTGRALVCLHGPSKAGKSRSMIEAVKHELPDAAIVVPDRTRANLQTILDSTVLEDAAAAYKGQVVLWLDDLEGFVRIGDRGFDAHRLTRLKRQLPALVVAATAGGRGRVTETEHAASALFEPLNELLERGVIVDLSSELVTPAELAALAAVVPSDLAAEMKRGLGAVAVSGRRLVQILRDKSHPRFDDGRVCPEGAAVTSAAIAVYHLGLTEPIPNDLLRKLFACYWHKATLESFMRALEWATEPLYGHVSLLRDLGGAHAPYDYLVQCAPRGKPDTEWCVWQQLMTTDKISADGISVLGGRAYELGRIEDALDALQRADSRGSAVGGYNLGFVLRERGDLAGGEAAWRRADERGDPSAALNLGVLLRERGDLEGAQAAYRRAEERGGANAAHNLGGLLWERGDLAGAEAAWRRADEGDDAGAALNLGVLLMERGDFEGAEAAFRRADARGAAGGAQNLGVMLTERRNLKGAEAAFRRADKRGSAEGAFSLGLLLEERKDSAGAEAAWRRADERGSAAGAYNVGLWLKQRRDVEGAKAAWRRADERGSADGASALGVLLKQRGDLEGAEAAYRRAVERGSASGASNLGALLYERGDLDGAEAVLRRADERGSSDGAFNLGVLLDERGDSVGADGAWRRADERGSAEGASKVGLLLRKRGDEEGAEAAYRRADDRGSAEGAFLLGLLLTARGDLAGAEATYRRADDRGDGRGAHNLGVLFHERGDLEGAEAAWRRADERGSAGAASDLGVLLQMRGDLEAAEAAYRRADERGDAGGAYNLGVLSQMRGDLEAAEILWRRADERGSANAAHNLGVLARMRGDLEAAEAALRRAAERSEREAVSETGPHPAR